ncbi:hypothetical protein KBZ94_40200 [Streptomyces sp. RM72]|uniref:hypothetical protein n=1 Tax=Streptomyces sp. RM72 TaxID=1115510 RepID=UPI001B37B6A5|nr:hypothetical protein [Streptomyces sp. RM72]MBQ0891068.1 hypothetical protein [Streptomyces sp. RM72]
MMSPQSQPAQAPRPGAAAAPARIRRAVTLPGPGGEQPERTPVRSDVTSPPVTSSSDTASSAQPPAAASQPSGQARAWLGARRASRPSRTPDTGASTASGAAEPSALTAFVPDAEGAGRRTARRETAAGAAPQSRAVHKPVLVAAAVAGAVLAAVPFIPQRGGTINYEGQGASPVTTFAAEGGAKEPDGQSSSLPLDDAGDSRGVPAVPLPGPSEPDRDPAAETRGTEKGTGSEGAREHAKPGPDEKKPGTDGKDPGRKDPAHRYVPAVSGGLASGGAVAGDKAPHGTTADDSAGRTQRRTVLSALGAKSSGTSGTVHTKQAAETGQPVRKKAPAQTAERQAPANRTARTIAPTVTPVSKRTEEKEAVGRPVERVIAATYVLSPGQPVTSGGTGLSMEADGNLVVRDDTGVVRWAANTAGLGHHAVFQADGNLVVVAADGHAVWSSGTAGNPGASLAVQTSGRVLIRSAGGTVLWSVGVSK